MDKPIDRIERETMLLGRYMHLLTPRVEWRLDRSAYILLSRIQAEGPMSIGQLGDAFGLDASTLNRQTAAMQRAGVVERIADPDGGIARKFAITEEGSAASTATAPGTWRASRRSSRTGPPRRRNSSPPPSAG